uniref:Putative 30.5 kDa secreted protein n=1 Tax=Ochlerotatus triseriatus TaxID=7162 RepID=C6ZQU9_OCHTR
MEKLHLIALLALASVSVTLALDWYALSQANYAAIQNGLAQLNNAATQMNQSIIEQQDRVLAGLDDLDDTIRKSLLLLWVQYPNLNITMDQMRNTANQINKAANYKWYVANIADDYKQSVTNNVMIPAQTVVQNILTAMTTFYAQQWQSCAQTYAPQLVQPQTSVGRLQQCISMAVPYFKTVADTTLVMFANGKSAVATILNLLNACSPSSTNCVTKFLNDLPNLLSNVVNGVSRLEGIPSSIIQPGKPAVKECVDLITADIQEILQGLVNKTSSC